jgi:hypothetical protein
MRRMLDAGMMGEGFAGVAFSVGAGYGPLGQELGLKAHQRKCGVGG